MNYKEFERHIKHLQGSVLTIVDASNADREQRKAIKDLINSAFSRKMFDVHAIEPKPQVKESSHDRVTTSERGNPQKSNPGSAR